jgi:hypothetical protein
VQPRLDIHTELAGLDQAARLPELEEAFVNVAASWAKRTGVSAAALREVGVPASVSSGLASCKSAGGQKGRLVVALHRDTLRTNVRRTVSASTPTARDRVDHSGEIRPLARESPLRNEASPRTGCTLEHLAAVTGFDHETIERLARTPPGLHRPAPHRPLRTRTGTVPQVTPIGRYGAVFRPRSAHEDYPRLLRSALVVGSPMAPAIAG